MKKTTHFKIIRFCFSFILLSFLWTQAPEARVTTEFESPTTSRTKSKEKKKETKKESKKEDKSTDDDRMLRAYNAGVSDFWVESSGIVVKVLSDDKEGNRHQRFLVRLNNGLTILISHNIDVAPRVEGLYVNDRVTFRGEYVWNNKGGVVHWTHLHPAGKKKGGWIQHKGRRYE